MKCIKMNWRRFASGALACLLLSVFGMQCTAHAEFYTGSHGLAYISGGWAYLGNNSSGNSSGNAGQRGIVRNGTIKYELVAPGAMPYLNQICFDTSSFIPFNSMMNFTVAIYYPTQLPNGFRGFTGDQNFTILDQSYATGADNKSIITNITAINRAGNNSYFCLGGQNFQYGAIDWLGGNNGQVNVFVSSISWVGVYDGETFNNTMIAIQGDIRKQIDAIQQLAGAMAGLSTDDIVNQIKAQQAAQAQQAQAQLEATQKQTEAIEQGNQQQQEQWQKEEDKANEAIDGDNGAPDTDAMQEGANGYFSIFTAIFDASKATSCVLPEIAAFGFSLGRLDLCVYTPPTWVRGAMGAVATIAVAWCGIRVIKRVAQVATGAIS